MKKIIIFLIILAGISIQVIGCSKDRTGNRKNENQTIEAITSAQKNNILEIAYQSLSEPDKNTVINWKDGSVEEYKDTSVHSISSKNGFINIQDKDLYRVSFRTNSKALGPITIYIDKKSSSFLGFDLRN